MSQWASFCVDSRSFRDFCKQPEKQKLMLAGLSTCVHSWGLALFSALSSSGTGSDWVPRVVHYLENYKCFLTEGKSKWEKIKQLQLQLPVGAAEWTAGAWLHGALQSGGSRRSLNPRDFIYRVGAWEDRLQLSWMQFCNCLLLGLGLSVEDRTWGQEGGVCH